MTTDGMNERHGRMMAIMRHPECMCGAKGIRSDKYDAYYCPKSNIWLEEQCMDLNCIFCSKRPDKYDGE